MNGIATTTQIFQKNVSVNIAQSTTTLVLTKLNVKNLAGLMNSYHNWAFNVLMNVVIYNPQ